MNALVFAAGLGTRLRPWTLEHPKALVPVCGEPMLGRVLRKLSGVGCIGRVVVNVHHFATQITEYLRTHDFGLDITVSDESDLLLDTGGGMARAIELLGGPGELLLVHNADILTDFPVGDMLAAHSRTDGADVSLLVASRESSRQFLFDAGGRLRGWKNLRDGRVLPSGLDASGLHELAFGGVHLLGARAQRALLDHAAASGVACPFGITPYYIDSCRVLDIRSYEPPEPYMWFDIGSPDKLAEAEKYLKSSD